MQTNLKLNPTNNSKQFQVQLNLNFQTRYIGKLDVSGEGIFTTSRKHKHLFRIFNAIGINYQLLTDSNIPFKYIKIIYTDENGIKRILETTRNYFFKKGIVKKFNSFELQSLLPLSEFGINKAIQLERNVGVQENLFQFS